MQSSSSIVISLSLFLCKNKNQQKDTWRIICSKNVNEQKKIIAYLQFFTGIYYRIYGYGKCSWIGSETTTGTGKNDKSIAFANYAGKEEYLDATNYIIGSKNGNRYSIVNCCVCKFSLPHLFA